MSDPIGSALGTQIVVAPGEGSISLPEKTPTAPAPIAAGAPAQTTAQKVKADLDEARALIDGLSTKLSGVAALIPGFGSMIAISISGLDGLIDVVDDTVDALVK